MKQWFEKLRAYPVVVFFFTFLLGFAVLDALWPRRANSELENRELAQYPAVTLKGILDNTWMSKYESYTKDQFALRDNWIDLKSRAETLLLKTENNGVLFGADEYLFKKEFSLNEKAFDKNVTALEKWIARHPGEVEVMIVPSASTVLEDKLPFAAPMADENAALDAMAERIAAAGGAFVDVRPVLREHKADEIFYRTDHHWTTDGAYLAYTQYLQSKGKAAFGLDTAKRVEIPNFYGTNYSSARKPGIQPDTLAYYDLANPMTVFTLNKDGTKTETTGTLYDPAKLETRDKYAAFLRGNNGFSVIEGSGEGSILIVKDSYANCFVPFLTASYAKIAVVDFRANTDKIDAIMAEGSYDDVLFLYSFRGFSEDTYFASRIASA